MMFSKDMAKELAFERAVVEKYPFLRQRDIDGTVDMDAKYPLMYLEIPCGWLPLFLLMCGDIKTALEKEGAKAMEDFYFFQVKEKYNRLTCYHTGSREIVDIIEKYGHISRFVCTKCGKPATFETDRYIASFCDDCWKDRYRHEDGEWLEFSDTFTISGYRNGQYYRNEISTKDEWNRYLKSLGGF